jgi:hypothetical protein
VTAVRPPIFPPSHAAQPARPDAARLAAQKAFFDLALGKAAQPAQAAATVAAAAPNPAPAAASAPRIPAADAEKPQKTLRPGSLLDIRV